MDYWLIGIGLGAVGMAGISLWWAIKRYHRQLEAERKRTKQRERRAAKKASLTEHSANSDTVFGSLNGTDKSLYGRRES
jgi:hypothetical protein